jgi:hypothetical protein
MLFTGINLQLTGQQLNISQGEEDAATSDVASIFYN